MEFFIILSYDNGSTIHDENISLFLFLNSFYPSLRANDQSFESWNNKQFKNYPFECFEDGATQEYTRCSAENLNKYDWELRKELNDDKLWN